KIEPLETRPAEASVRTQKERQAPLKFEPVVPGSLPPISLLDPPSKVNKGFSPESLEGMSRVLELKLKERGVKADVVKVQPGPGFTRVELQPAAGVKVSRITKLAKDLARSLAVISVRVVEVIPGKTTIGIEIPNEDREIVRLSEVLQTREFDEAQSPVTLALGHDIGGKPVLADLARMPHLLVAGTTGSGKSVGVNAMLLSILFKSHPEDVRLIMIDPKMLELSIYEGIPHLLCPVVTDMKEAANALRWCVAEMERRYKLMAAMGVRNLAGFNRKVKDAQKAGEPLTDPLFRRESMDDIPPELDTLPVIVVVIDEFADMMMIVGKKVEELIARIAQKARAAGIHLILATQRPSVDVITGLIKANIPTRIAFQVSSRIDSRTILDQGGAEQLLGHGDMLYMPPGTSLPVRVHGAFVSDDEVHRLVDEWKQRGEPDYIQDILDGADQGGSGGFDGGGGGDGEEDESLYDEAVRFVTESRNASISSLQRQLNVGHNRAVPLMESTDMTGDGRDRLLSRAQTLTGGFSQMTLSANGANLQETTGTLALKRPGKFRWHTDPPLEQLLISDGEKIWLYDPDLEQVTIQQMDQRLSHTPALLLSGDVSKLQESFDIELTDGGSVVDFTLTPREADSMFDSLRVSFNDGLINDMQMSDPVGQRTNILFHNVQLNAPLDDAQFSFEVPEGVDVISE